MALVPDLGSAVKQSAVERIYAASAGFNLGVRGGEELLPKYAAIYSTATKRFDIFSPITGGYSEGLGVV